MLQWGSALTIRCNQFLVLQWDSALPDDELDASLDASKRAVRFVLRVVVGRSVCACVCLHARAGVSPPPS